MAFSMKLFAPLILFLIFLLGSSSAQLSNDYYFYSCPQVFNIVKPILFNAIAQDKRMGASILRLFFHDCFVNGCDGSILLDDTPTFIGEKTARPNFNSLRGFDVVDEIKEALEEECPGVVSCADILAIASMQSVNMLGGPFWNVKLGRRDATTASLADANSNIPSPFASLDQLIAGFSNKGLSIQELVALSGAHTIGQATCVVFRSHIYNDTDIDETFAQVRQQNCPPTFGNGDNNLAPNDYQTPDIFDNQYFNNLGNFRGLFHSDQELYNNSPTDLLVIHYANNPLAFFTDFILSMIKMGDISPLTGSNGEIRKNCRVVNGN